MSSAKVHTYPTTIDANYSHYYFWSVWYLYYWVHLSTVIHSRWTGHRSIWSVQDHKNSGVVISQHQHASYLTTPCMILTSPNAGQITNYLCQKFWWSHIFVGIFLGVKTARGGMQSCRNCSHSRAQIGVSFDISMIWLSCKNVEFPIFWTLTSFDVMISAQKASCVSIEMNLGFDLFRCASISYNHVGHSVIIKSVMVSRFCHLLGQSTPTGGKA